MRVGLLMDSFSNKTSSMSFEMIPHVIVVMICLIILAGALAFTPVKSGLELMRIPIPHSCLFYNLTGIPCPGCGLTRSLVSAVHGNLAGSFSHHRLGMIVLVYVLLQLTCRLGVILAPAQRPRLLIHEKRLNRGVIILGILFGLNWILSLWLL